jgi:hypothetical protein
MTPVGIARARDLQNGVKMSPDTVRRMKAFFDRHEVDKKGATWDEQGKGWQAWNGWGGDAGYSWARKVVGQMEARDKKTEFVAGRDCGQDEGGTFGPDNKCAVGYGRPPIKGGYTPTRPGGKFPKDYVRPTPQEEKKKEKLNPEEWASSIRKDFDKKMLFRKFTSEKFAEINQNPNSEESKKLLSLIEEQNPHKQNNDMFRGLRFKTNEEAQSFVEKLKNGVETKRTLTSFTPSKNVANEFAYDKKTNPTSVLMVLKKSQNLRNISGVSLETTEKEFVLPVGKKLRIIGQPKIQKNVFGKGIDQIQVEVEEY